MGALGLYADEAYLSYIWVKTHLLFRTFGPNSCFFDLAYWWTPWHPSGFHLSLQRIFWWMENETCLGSSSIFIVSDCDFVVKLFSLTTKCHPHHVDTVLSFQTRLVAAGR